jgi:hypothetical protein
MYTELGEVEPVAEAPGHVEPEPSPEPGQTQDEEKNQ